MYKPTRNVRYGQTGNAVKWIQERLGVVVDGDFFGETLKKLNDFQKKNKLRVCEVANKEVMDKLEAEFQKKSCTSATESEVQKNENLINSRT